VAGHVELRQPVTGHEPVLNRATAPVVPRALRRRLPRVGGAAGVVEGVGPIDVVGPGAVVTGGGVVVGMGALGLDVGGLAGVVVGVPAPPLPPVPPVPPLPAGVVVAGAVATGLVVAGAPAPEPPWDAATYVYAAASVSV
jgi:hypothetical protein